jgi:broad specificity phosphatase PhoE
MTDIYFIRHGQASFGEKNYDRLSKTGHDQAILLADYFIDMEAYFPVVYSGTKKRQIDTARPIVSRLTENDVGTQLVVLPGLDEFDISSFLHHCKDDIVRDDPSFAEDLHHCFTDFRSFQRIFVKALSWSLSVKKAIPNIECFSHFKNRVCFTIENIVKESSAYKKVAVVTSGGVLALLMQMVQGFSDIEAIGKVWSFYNTSVTIFYADQGALEFKLKNSVVHLNDPSRPELLTYV